MYKDKDKQREANRQASKKYRDSMTDKGMTVKTNIIPISDIPVIVIPKTVTPEGDVDKDKLPANYGQPDCEYMHCQSKRVNNSKNIINHGPYKTQHELGEHEINRVSLPGDPDYNGVCLDAKYDDRRIGTASTSTACS